jgi:uncharacterized damage-inducible protein DinB
MHPHLVEVFARLDRAHQDLCAAVELVPRELRGQRPAADRWSVAEIVEHLALAEQRFCDRLRNALAEAKAAGLGAETQPREPLPERVVTLLIDRENRRMAPDFIQPKGEMDGAQALAALERAREEFRTTLTAADGLALSTVTSEHPVMGRLSAYQWVELVAGHEARHAEQVREVASHIAHAS